MTNYIYRHRLAIGVLAFFTIAFAALNILYPGYMFLLYLKCHDLQDLQTKQTIQSCSFETATFYDWYTFVGIILSGEVLIIYTYFERKKYRRSATYL